MSRADPLFKLRLPPTLRERIEREAIQSGRSLTGEILHRLEESFPSTADRLAALEARVFDPETGIERLASQVEELQREVAGIAARR